MDYKTLEGTPKSMEKEIITENYLVALKYIVDGWQVKRFGNDYSGVYWKLTNDKPRTIRKNTKQRRLPK